jgi:hypothetical protein
MGSGLARAMGMLMAHLSAMCGTAPCAITPSTTARMIRRGCQNIAQDAVRRWMEGTTMFQVELLSGGVFTVYAVQPEAEIFLIYRDNQWEWIDIPECKPYTYPFPMVTKNFTEGTT